VLVAWCRYSVEGGRNFESDTANISLRDLDEYYFVPLKATVKQADVGAYMCSYVAPVVVVVSVERGSEGERERGREEERGREGERERERERARARERERE